MKYKKALKRLFSVAICSVVISLLSSCGSSTSAIEILEFGFGRGQYGTQMIIGQAKNTSSRTLDYVQLTFNLYDSSGAQVGSTLANINNFEPGKIWKFEAPILDKGVTTAKITDVTTF